MSDMQSRRQAMTAEDVRIMLSSPVYAYGINLLPAERVAYAVMDLNSKLALEMRETHKYFTLEELDERFQMLLSVLEMTEGYTRGEDHPPIVSKEMWLQTQQRTIEKLSRGEKQ
jgi:excisionase family DNA binding protein